MHKLITTKNLADIEKVKIDAAFDHSNYSAEIDPLNKLMADTEAVKIDSTNKLVAAQKQADVDHVKFNVEIKKLKKDAADNHDNLTAEIQHVKIEAADHKNLAAEIDLLKQALAESEKRWNEVRKALDNTQKRAQADHAALSAQIENLKKAAAAAHHAKLSCEIENFKKSLATPEA